MRFGVCTGIDNAPLLKEVGFDYIELSMNSLAELTEEQMRERESILKSLDLRAETYNGFYDSTKRVVGEDTTPEDELRDYTHRVLERAARLGGQIAVYGSSKARNIPEGFSRERAYEQFCHFARLSGEIAQQYGLVVVLEPLNKLETNFFHTVEEGLQIMRDVDHPNVRVLADMYHVCKERKILPMLCRPVKICAMCILQNPMCVRFPVLKTALITPHSPPPCVRQVITPA